MPTTSTNYNRIGTGIVQALLRETRAVGLAFAGIGVGTGVGLSATTMLWAADVDIVQWGSASVICLAAGVFLGFTLVVAYGIRLKTSHEHLSSLGRNIEAWFACADAIRGAINVEHPSLGNAAKRKVADIFPATLETDAEKQTTALLERFMLPRNR